MEKLKVKEAFFKETLRSLLKLAKDEGASDAEVALNTGAGFSLSVRKENVETIEHHEDQSLSVTLYFGQQKGSASTTDLSANSLKATIKAAAHIAQFTLADPCAGLPESEYLAKTWPELSLYHPWGIDLDEALKLAKTTESYALGLDQRLSNSDGVSVSSYDGLNVYGSSQGFLAATYASQHEFSIGLIAGEGSDMQRDFSYTVARDPKDLWSKERVAHEAVTATLRRLNPRKLATGTFPVIFEAPIAGSLISAYLKAVSGGNLYRESSFLLNSLDAQVFPEYISLFEDPFIPKALGSSPFDAEGVVVKPQYLVAQGRVKTYLLGSYAARKLGLKPTGHAGGAHNVAVKTDKVQSFDALVKTMGQGLIVTELMGQGINLVTGDYSRGASGFWVEGGEIQYPVAEITIAGNLRDMFKNIIGVANDVETRGRIHCGSILIEKMTLAGM